MADPTVNPWQTLSTAIVHDDAWLQLRMHEVINPKGRRTQYRVVHYKRRAIAILPIDAAGGTVLVGQYRYTLNRYSWEPPGGGGPLDEAPEVSAARELAEETGLRARHLRQVLRMDLSNGITDEQAYCYLAWGLEQGQAQPDESEVLQLRRLPFREVVALTARGEITEAVSVALVLRVQQLVAAGEAPPEVLEALRTVR
jgi:8-oxo-dGTP pyrophosphatase MutT (NUDIX family)